MRTVKPWTEFETNLLYEGLMRGQTFAEIAKDIPGRTTQSCNGRFYHLRDSGEWSTIKEESEQDGPRMIASGSSRTNSSAANVDQSLIPPSLRRVRDALPGIVNASTTPEESYKAWEKHLDQVRLQDRIKRLESGTRKTRQPATTASNKSAKEAVMLQAENPHDDLDTRAETLIYDLKTECEKLNKTNKEIALTLKERNGLKRKRAELEEALKGDGEEEEEEDWELGRRDPRKRTRRAVSFEDGI